MNRFKKIIRFIANPHLLLCLGLAWTITNGWAYVLLGIGAWLKISWMTAVSSSYLTLLWLPLTPEKLITVAIAIFLLRRLFPDDRDTLRILKELAEKFRKKTLKIVKQEK